MILNYWHLLWRISHVSHPKSGAQRSQLGTLPTPIGPAVWSRVNKLGIVTNVGKKHVLRSNKCPRAQLKRRVSSTPHFWTPLYAHMVQVWHIAARFCKITKVVRNNSLKFPRREEAWSRVTLGREVYRGEKIHLTPTTRDQTVWPRRTLTGDVCGS